MRRRNLPERRHCDGGALAVQCCPMDTYSGRTKLDLHGDEVEIADCSCGDGCQCTCLDCACPWPDEDEEDW